MTADTQSAFDRHYLETWTEPDPERRRANIERMWSAGGRMVVSPIGMSVQGVDEIAAHVTRVHEQRAAAAHGLRQEEFLSALPERFEMASPRIP